MERIEMLTSHLPRAASKLAAFTLALLASASSDAWAAQPLPVTLQSALAKADFAQAAGLGATAADVLRAAQAKGRFLDLDPAMAEVVIAADGTILDAYAMRPLPPLVGVPADARTVEFEGTSDAFVGRGAAYILRPAGAGMPERVKVGH